MLLWHHSLIKAIISINGLLSKTFSILKENHYGVPNEFKSSIWVTESPAMYLISSIENKQAKKSHILYF